MGSDKMAAMNSYKKTQICCIVKISLTTGWSERWNISIKLLICTLVICVSISALHTSRQDKHGLLPVVTQRSASNVRIWTSLKRFASKRRQYRHHYGWRRDSGCWRLLVRLLRNSWWIIIRNKWPSYHITHNLIC